MKPMDLKVAATTSLLMLCLVGGCSASSNTSVQKGRLSLEGYAFSTGGLGLSAEVGLSSRVSLIVGNADAVPAIQCKLQLPDSDKNSDYAVFGGAVLISNPGLLIGAGWHFKMNSRTRLFADVSYNSANGWGFTNIGLGITYNLTSNTAVIGTMRSTDGFNRFGLGMRISL